MPLLTCLKFQGVVLIAYWDFPCTRRPRHITENEKKSKTRSTRAATLQCYDGAEQPKAHTVECNMGSFFTQLYVLQDTACSFRADEKMHTRKKLHPEVTHLYFKSIAPFRNSVHVVERNTLVNFSSTIKRQHNTSALQKSKEKKKKSRDNTTE